LVVALLALLGFNRFRRRKVEKADEFQATGTGLRANSLFGSTGGQSVDTGSASTFNSSFIPAASQLDSNEVDPVAEADVYIAYGREEQAEDILKEALRLQPDRHAVRVKMLEIYSRRGDKASFNAVAQELRDRTGGVGEDWERGLKLGRALDPSNAMYAGGAVETLTRGPTTELRLNPNTQGSRPATLGGMAAVPATFAVDTAMGLQTRSEAPTEPMGVAHSTKMVPDTHLTPDTAIQVDSRLTVETKMPADSALGAGETTQAGPSTVFEATLPQEVAPAGRSGVLDPFGSSASGAIDFGALDFDLGGNTRPAADSSPAPKPPVAPTVFDLDLEPAARVLTPSVAAPTATGRAAIPDVDLTLPPRMAPPTRPAMAPTPAPAPAFSSFAGTPTQTTVQSALEESLSRPTLLGEVGALPGEQAPRMTSNTDQATVPLIDFDLTGADVELTGRRTETQAGSPMAAQMATKLDLARGYIDLGVKDGARELLEEVMRDGTRDQRQQAVELIKTVEV